MGKGDNVLFVFIVLFIIVFGIGYAYSKKPSFFRNFLASELPFFYDPYLIEDDFINEGYTRQHWLIGERVAYSSNEVSLSGVWGGRGAMTQYNVNLKNKDIKTKVRVSGGITGSDCKMSGSLAIGLNGDMVGVSSGYSTIEFTIEFIKDVIDKNKFVVLVNGEPKKEIIIQGETAYISYVQSGQGVCGSTGEISSAIIYLKSKPYFSCQTDNNEVWISDSFGEGSTFDIHSLTYEPTKFCPQDYPAVVRDYRERGIKADTRGTITEQLTRGEKFTVPAFQAYEIRYATTYKEEMGERCLLGYVYDTKLKKCIQKVFEQDYIIKDCHSEGCPDSSYICRDNGVCEKYTEKIINLNCQELGCPSGYICLPEGYCVRTLIEQVKPTCIDITCDVKYNEYCEMRGDFPICVRPYKITEVIRDRIIIQVGKNQKSFSDSLTIGYKTITASGLSADTTCIANSVNNNPECFASSITFDGKTYSLKYNEEVSINDYFKVKSYSGGRYQTDEGKIDIINYNFVLTISNFDFLKTEPIRGDAFDYYVIKDSSREMCFNLIDNLGAFTQEQAGYSLKKTTDLVTMETRTMEAKAIQKGSQKFCLPIDSARYGELFYVINPYIKLGDEIFFDDEQLTYNYKIVDKIPINETIIYKEGCTKDSDCGSTMKCLNNVCAYTTPPLPSTIKDCTTEGCPEGYSCKNNVCVQKIIPPNYWLYISIGAGIFILLLFIITRKK